MASIAPDPNPRPEYEKDNGVTTLTTPRSEGGPGGLHPVLSRWQTTWQRPYATWHPTFFQIRPLVGITALCATIGCVFASFSILVVSDNQPVSEWPISPTVYLAIVTAIANGALALAWLEASPISWWYNVSRGKPIRDLERRWQISRSVVQAIAYSRRLSILNVACSALAFVIIDGPLLQRASTVVRATETSDITLNLRLPPELPTGFAGVVYDSSIHQTTAQRQVLRNYVTLTPMHLDITPACTGTCRRKVLGPGVAKTGCTSRTWPITREMLHSVNASWGPWKYYALNAYGNPVAHLPIFYIDLSPNYDQFESEAATLTTGLAFWSNWEGEFVETTCYLLPATVEYTIEIEDDDVVNLPSSPDQGRFVRLANNTRVLDQSTAAAIKKKQFDTIDGITAGLSILVDANASAAFTGTYWLFDPTTYNTEVFKHENITVTGTSELSFFDPTADVVSKYNQLMFRGATLVSSGSAAWPHLDRWFDPGVSTNQTIAAVREITQNVFRTDLKWYAGAAVLELVTVLLILPLFGGCWTLGCNLTMSPFAIALAFNSPILGDVNSAAGAKGVVHDLGDVKLMSGVVDSSGQPDSPNGSSSEAGLTSGRLGVGENQFVAKPRKGMKFRE